MSKDEPFTQFQNVECVTESHTHRAAGRGLPDAAGRRSGSARLGRSLLVALVRDQARSYQLFGLESVFIDGSESADPGRIRRARAHRGRTAVPHRNAIADSRRSESRSVDWPDPRRVMHADGVSQAVHCGKHTPRPGKPDDLAGVGSKTRTCASTLKTLRDVVAGLLRGLRCGGRIGKSLARRLIRPAPGGVPALSFWSIAPHLRLARRAQNRAGCAHGQSQTSSSGFTRRRNCSV
jgi:hypothetical protein